MPTVNPAQGSLLELELEKLLELELLFEILLELDGAFVVVVVIFSVVVVVIISEELLESELELEFVGHGTHA